MKNPRSYPDTMPSAESGAPDDPWRKVGDH